AAVAEVVAPEAAGCLSGGLLQAHFAFDAGKVLLPLAGLPLTDGHAAMGRQVVEPGRRENLHVGGDDVVEAQIFVDVGRGHLAGGNGADGGGGAGDAVAAGEDALLGVEARVLLGQEAAPAHRDAALFKVVRFHALADGHQNEVGGNAHLGAVGLVGAGTAVAAHGADDLRLYPQR